MIDFRYHLISIIAVFLALGLGIVMGSTVLDDRLVEHLQRRVDAFGESNDELQQRIDALEAELDASQAFAEQSAPWLIQEELVGRTIVLVELEGVDGDVVSELRSTIEAAGGAVPTVITLTDKFALAGQPERDQLALAIESTASTERDLRVDAATVIGDRLGAVAVEATTNRGRSLAQGRLDALLTQLQDTEFVAIDSTPDVGVAPAGSLFVFVGGASETPPFDPAAMTVRFVTSISERGGTILAAEPLGSVWGLVPAIRDDGEASARVSTVDQADRVAGRIAVVLGLREQFEGATDHYGIRDDATKVIPEPAPAT